jgi:hypothetical protein
LADEPWEVDCEIDADGDPIGARIISGREFSLVENTKVRDQVGPPGSDRVEFTFQWATVGCRVFITIVDESIWHGLAICMWIGTKMYFGNGCRLLERLLPNVKAQAMYFSHICYSQHLT